MSDPTADDDHPEFREIVELSRDECRTLLRRHQVGRVVFVDTRGPVALPVNYVLDHDDIVFRTEVWSSLFATPSTGNVSFEVDEIDEGNRLACSVLATGTVREVQDPAELRHVERLHPQPWTRGPRDHYLRLTVQVMTGRRLVSDDGQTAET
jgi:nitroimidazol reductase NimA-like FMN-containing flavoprotein (pyridoxamine 5'-phosphate oxidase superfamily)